MHSSMVENSLEADSTTDETKPVDHTSCYHPFQSSFDAGLTKNSPIEHPPDQTHIPCLEEQKSAKTMPDESKTFSALNMMRPWNEGVRRESRRFYQNQDDQSQSSDVFGHSAFNLAGNFAITRNQTGPADRLGHIQMNPVWFYPEFFVPTPSNSRQCGQMTGYSRVAALNCGDNRRARLDFRSCDGSLVAVKNFTVPSIPTGFPCNSHFRNVRGSHQGDGVATGRSLPCQDLQKTGYNRPMMCNFCKNNKEVPDIYMNHYLYDPKTKKLTCPVLRKHVCEICGETGDRAHTLQYCPINRQRGLQAKVPVLLKTRTITNSTGKIRRN